MEIKVSAGYPLTRDYSVTDLSLERSDRYGSVGEMSGT